MKEEGRKDQVGAWLMMRCGGGGTGMNYEKPHQLPLSSSGSVLMVSYGTKNGLSYVLGQTKRFLRGCLTALPGPAWVLLSKTFKPF